MSDGEAPSAECEVSVYCNHSQVDSDAEWGYFIGQIDLSKKNNCIRQIKRKKERKKGRKEGRKKALKKQVHKKCNYERTVSVIH